MVTVNAGWVGLWMVQYYPTEENTVCPLSPCGVMRWEEMPLRMERRMYSSTDRDSTLEVGTVLRASRNGGKYGVVQQG